MGDVDADYALAVALGQDGWASSDDDFQESFHQSQRVPRKTPHARSKKAIRHGNSLKQPASKRRASSAAPGCSQTTPPLTSSSRLPYKTQTAVSRPASGQPVSRPKNQHLKSSSCRAKENPITTPLNSQAIPRLPLASSSTLNSLPDIRVGATTSNEGKSSQHQAKTSAYLPANSAQRVIKTVETRIPSQPQLKLSLESELVSTPLDPRTSQLFNHYTEDLDPGCEARISCSAECADAPGSPSCINVNGNWAPRESQPDRIGKGTWTGMGTGMGPGTATRTGMAMEKEPAVSLASHFRPATSPASHVQPAKSPASHTQPAPSPSCYVQPSMPPACQAQPATSPAGHAPPATSPASHAPPATSPASHAPPTTSPPSHAPPATPPASHAPPATSPTSPKPPVRSHTQDMRQQPAQADSHLDQGPLVDQRVETRPNEQLSQAPQGPLEHFEGAGDGDSSDSEWGGSECEGLSDSSEAESGEEGIHCPVCGSAIHNLGDQQREQHVNACLDQSSEQATTSSGPPQNANESRKANGSGHITDFFQSLPAGATGRLPAGGTGSRRAGPSSHSGAARQRTGGLPKGAFQKHGKKTSGHGRSAVERGTPHPSMCIRGTSFRVDAFKYLTPDCTHWFLTHFHTDHYQGLTKRFCHGTIYCSPITAQLVHTRLGVPMERIQPIELDRAVEIAGVEVTFLEANHCPGAVMIMFQPAGKGAILHTGDFRLHPSMLSHPLLTTIPIHTLILDTTYADPQYDFPPQEVVSKFVVDAIRAEAFNPRTLFLIGTYTIGKERLFLDVARQLQRPVFVGLAKHRLLACMGLPEEDMARLALDDRKTAIHAVPLWSVGSFKKLGQHARRHRGQFTTIVSFSPTGWSFGRGKKRQHGRRWQQGTLIRYEVPYSEHSSFPELCAFVRAVQPAHIIPSVVDREGASAQEVVERILAGCGPGS